jgi:prepilin-type N-terminal cleavage/methylation domain-containing protein
MFSALNLLLYLQGFARGYNKILGRKPCAPKRLTCLINLQTAVKKNPTKLNRSGFTLLELVIATFILGLLAAIALPNLMKQVEKARTADAKSNLGALNRAQQAYYFENSVFANSLQNLASEVTIGSWNGSAYQSAYYTYSITSSSLTEVHHLAVPILTYNQDIKQITAAVFKSGSAFTSRLCQADNVGDTPNITAPTTCNNGTFTDK